MLAGVALVVIGCSGSSGDERDSGTDLDPTGDLGAEVHAFLQEETSGDVPAFLAQLDARYGAVTFDQLAAAVRWRPRPPVFPGLGVHHGQWLNAHTGEGAEYEAYVPETLAAAAADRFPLIVFLHGAGGTGAGIVGQPSMRAAADALGAILVAPTDAFPCDWSASEECMSQVVLLLQTLKRRYPVDDRMVVLSGFSMGGRGSFSVGVAYPEPYCGVVPVAGTIGAVFDSPDLEMHRDYCCPHLDNAFNVRLHYISGDQDNELMLFQNRGCALCIEQAAHEHRYAEVAGVGHVFDVDRWHGAVSWALERPRPSYPSRVVYNLTKQASGIVPGGIMLHQQLPLPQYWAVITARQDEAEPASLVAEVAGAEVRVNSENVASLQLYLADDLVDLDQPVKIVANGATVAERTLTRDRALLLGEARRRSEREMLYAARVDITL